MIEYFILTMVLLVGSSVLNLMDFSNTWLLLGLIVITLPSIYAALTGAPYEPSDKNSVKKMIALARLKKGERAVDLGCGDGRLVRAARKEGAEAVGYEISFILYWIARVLNRGAGRIFYQSYWRADVSDADVIFCYQLPKFEKRFKQIIWPQLKPGCRVVVNTFALQTLEPVATYGNVYLYIKPWDEG
ncbi:methyltransferase domain-containing protein [bacterium]|nr:methyltransferase domain-containing protein [bacterium]